MSTYPIAKISWKRIRYSSPAAAAAQSPSSLSLLHLRLTIASSTLAITSAISDSVVL